MINSTLFSFQRTILRHPSELSEGLPWISFYILSHSFELVKNFFVLFSRPEQRIFCCRRCSTLCCSLTTCIILHDSSINVNTILHFYWFIFAMRQKEHITTWCAQSYQMVAAQRFELRTLRVWTACSSQLSYAAIVVGRDGFEPS